MQIRYIINNKPIMQQIKKIPYGEADYSKLIRKMENLFSDHS